MRFQPDLAGTGGASGICNFRSNLVIRCVEQPDLDTCVARGTGRVEGSVACIRWPLISVAPWPSISSHVVIFRPQCFVVPLYNTPSRSSRQPYCSRECFVVTVSIRSSYSLSFRPFGISS